MFNMNYNIEKTLPLATGIKKIKENTDVPLIGFAGGVWTTLFYCLYEKNERQNLHEIAILWTLRTGYRFRGVKK